MATRTTFSSSQTSRHPNPHPRPNPHPHPTPHPNPHPNPNQAPEISRLAWLILFIWSISGGLGLLVVLFICCDCAISGRMRVVVMFTDKQSAFAGATAGNTAGAAKPGLAQKFGGASHEDAGRSHRHGSDFDRVSNWGPPGRQPLGPQGAVGYQEPLVGPRGNMPPPQFAMDRSMRV